LGPLLCPSSIAFVGASPKPDTPGNTMLQAAAVDGYTGRIHAVNPRYSQIGESVCFPNLDALPERVEHVVLGIGNAQLEDGLSEAIRHGAKAVTIFASCNLTGNSDDQLAERLASMAREAGVAICGGNGMGFANPSIGLRVSGYAAALPMRPGSVAFITQSGSAFSALAYNDERLKYALAVSSGRELTTEAADYMDWALDQPQTKAVGLFLETARSPDRLVAALEKADALNIPVVALKVGKSQIAAEFAVSHSGAIAGDSAAWEALFSRHGVMTVETLDQLAATLLLASECSPLPPGGLASIHDSGGEREMVADLAEKMHIPFARIAPGTLERLPAHLDPGLPPANPLDAWGTGRDFEAQVQGCMAAMLDDPDTAIGVLFQDVRDGSYIAEGFTRAVVAAARGSEKPAAVVTNYASVNHRSLALRVTEAGVPVIDGTTEGLLAIGQLMEARDRRSRSRSFPNPVSGELRQRWRERLASPTPLAPIEAQALLADYKIPTVQTLNVASLDEAIAASKRLGWPVVLKTAEAGIDHKSEAGGVALGLRDEKALRDAYEKMSRLGPAMTLSAMAHGRVEIAFGMLRDPQFGPLLVLAAGGIFIEALADRAVALPPVSLEEADAMLSRLRIRRLMGALRNLPAVDIPAAAQAFAQFSLLAQDLGDLIHELDVNPLLVSENGIVAVDALVVTRAEAQKRTE
jgi:acyl-CoA synthetase (NDP forming)